MTYKTRKWRNGIRNWRGEIKETCRERRIKIWKKAKAERKNYTGRRKEIEEKET